MIVSLSVENFRSFSAEETFSLLASPRLSATHEDHTVAIPDSDQRVLRSAVLYGANGAGKSNLFLALRYLKELALKTRAKGVGMNRSPFQLGITTPKSTIDLQFIAGDKLYRYGLVLDDEQIEEEWLIRVARGKERVLFERESKSGQTSVRSGTSLKAGTKLKALCTVGGPANQSFLATAGTLLEWDELGQDLRNVIRWFSKTLTTVAPDDMFGPLGHSLSEDPSFLEFAGDFLRSSSTGIDHLEIEKKEITEEELRKRIPESVVTQIMSSQNGEVDSGLTLVKNSEGQEFVIDNIGDRHVHQIAINSAHRDASGNMIRFALADESDGTRRLLDLIPTLHSYQAGGGSFFIDEIDRSLHPILVHKFLEFFFKSCTSGQQQIIITTHESTLLDLDLFRRDEIWFAEKDKLGGTHLYSLNDFKVRNDLEIRKHYLQGRFGAIPFLGNIDLLMGSKLGDTDG